MLDFVKNAFRGFLEILLWINLFLCAVFGGVIGHGLSYFGNYTFLGIIIGIIVGLFINIVGGGLIATIINIDDNIEELNSKTKTGSVSSSKTDSVSSSKTDSVSPLNLRNVSSVTNKLENKKCSRCKREVGADYTACPNCGNDTFE